MSNESNDLNQNSDNIQFNNNGHSSSSESESLLIKPGTTPLQELPDVDTTPDARQLLAKINKERAEASADAQQEDAPETLPIENKSEKPNLENPEASDEKDAEISSVAKEDSSTSEKKEDATKPVRQDGDKESSVQEAVSASDPIDEAPKSVDEVDPPTSDLKDAVESKKIDFGTKAEPKAPRIPEDATKPDRNYGAIIIGNADKDKTNHPVDESDDAKVGFSSENTPVSDETVLKPDKSKDDLHKDDETLTRKPRFVNVEKKPSILTFKPEKDDPAQKNPDTGVLPEDSPSWKKVIDGQSQGTTSTLGEQREVLFVIRGMIERVVMADNSTVTLGRFDTGTVANEEIDLIPYGAIDRGVSRRHCKIQLNENNLYVIDLQSTNGTFLAGIRLRPNEATLLRKGDELLLGRLAVQVLFR